MIIEAYLKKYLGWEKMIVNIKLLIFKISLIRKKVMEMKNAR